MHQNPLLLYLYQLQIYVEQNLFHILDLQQSGPDAVKYIVNHSSAQAIFCVPQTLHILLSFLSEIPSVRLIVVVGGLDELIPSLPSATGVKVVSFSKLITQGSSNHHPFCPPKPHDVATICYTSGTTGTPKGAVLSHGNLIANVAGGSLEIKFYPSDVYISYLPLTHIYERANQIILAYYGGSVGFYQGDNLKLLDDMHEFYIVFMQQNIGPVVFKYGDMVSISASACDGEGYALTPLCN